MVAPKEWRTRTWPSGKRSEIANPAINQVKALVDYVHEASARR